MITNDTLSVDIHAEEAAKHHAIKSVCKQLLTGWDTLSDTDIEVSCISGGISNALFGVKPPPPLQRAVFRIYGDNTEKFVDRSRELVMMPILHRHGFGPELLAAFSNGRIESFLPLRCMTPDEMPDPQHAQHIAAALARFHVAPMPGPKTAATPFLRIREWLHIARNLDFTASPDKFEIFKSFDFDALLVEVDQVESTAATFQSPVIFAHNDLLSGNIMISEPTRTLHNNNASVDSSSATPSSTLDSELFMTFIDFEYSDWAPRGFDWGNHFCEYAGFDCDYSKYPNTSQASIFIKSYLKAANAIASGDKGRERQEEGFTPSASEVARCVAEANVYALAAHMYWGSWALMQAKWSSIEFDYMGYAALRWKEYYKRKQEFLTSA